MDLIKPQLSENNFDNFISCIKNHDLKQFEEFISSGINIYQIKRNQHYYPTMIVTETPLFVAILSGANSYGDDTSKYTVNEMLQMQNVMVNALLDIYERDLDVLKGTNFTKALVAMPEFQTDDFLKLCEFSCPKDEKYFEPVLLKTNNKDPPKLAFLNRKNHKASRYIYKFKRIGTCDLNYEIQDWCSKTSYLEISFKHCFCEIGKRLFEHSFIDSSTKVTSSKIFCHSLVMIYLKKVEDYAEFFENYEFSYQELITNIVFGVKENVKFIIKSVTKRFGCSFIDLLEMNVDLPAEWMNMKTFYIHQTLQNFWIDLLDGITIDKHELYNEDCLGGNFLSCLFRSENIDLTIMNNFIEKNPAILDVRLKNNFKIIHYAVINGNIDIIKTIHEICKAKIFFSSDENAAIECLIMADKFFENEHEKVIKVLKLLTNGKEMEFLAKNALKILIRHIQSLMSFDLIKFILNLPFKINMNEMYDGQNVYMATCDYVNDVCTFEMIINYQNIDDWNIAGKTGTTLFMKVCHLLGNKIELIKKIIEQQPDCVRKFTEDGSNCLHHLGTNIKETLEVLLKAGADSTVVNKAGQKVINSAVNQPEIFELLLPFVEIDDSLLFDITSVEIWKMLLKRNINLSAVNSHGMTILDDFNIPNEVKELILDKIIENNFDFDFNRKDIYGNSVFLKLITFSKPKLFRRVLINFKNKIDFDICDNRGKSFASVMIQIPNVQLFCEYFEVIMSECLEEFMSRVQWDLVLYSENIFVIFNFLTLKKIINEFEKFVNNERIVKKIFLKYPNFLELLEDKIAFLVKIIYKCNNPEAFDTILNEINVEELMRLNFNGKNILHFIFSRNDEEMIHMILEILPEKNIKQLFNQSGQKNPFELLNDENKEIFKAYEF